jgi:hypothetical protein
MTSSAFRPLGRAHPYSLRTNFRREGLLSALLNFSVQVPNTAFSAFLPLWAIGRRVGNPGVLFVGSQVGAVASRLGAGRLADRYGRRAVLVPAMIGVAVTLVGMTIATGLPVFFALAIGYGALFGVAFVVLPALAGRGGSGRGPRGRAEHLRPRRRRGTAPGPVGPRPGRGHLGPRGGDRGGGSGLPARRGRVPPAAPPRAAFELRRPARARGLRRRPGCAIQTCAAGGEAEWPSDRRHAAP